ncbi:MAG: threonine ammonia-lyase [Coriobacteriia bacterium]|nr:threonine ammonia-lyase [Coriobacteriia bacterium]MCL2537337.1 threonine ammonia-lyase [Coriobacteriia bacterium]
MISLENIYQAAGVLKGVSRVTDLIEVTKLGTHDALYLKCENLQKTGSFKLRGAYYKISQLSADEAAAGIIACSAGNHAQGVALAAAKRGIDCTIVMPDGAPISKVEATRSLGAEVVLVPSSYDDAFSYARELQAQTGATFIHPFNDYAVMEGQATIGLEILNQLEGVDAIVAPIGGGGLISGVAYAIKKLNPAIKIYGVQASGAASMAESVHEHKICSTSSVTTFADGIAVRTPGDLTFPLVEQYVDEVVTVSEDEIATAILGLMEKEKLVAEGAGAASVAAVMFGKVPTAGKKTVCIVSGGNIDVNILSRVITRGLVTSGRNATLQIALEDKPGQLVGVSTIISQCGGNVVNVHYSGSDPSMAINSCFLTIGLETRDFDQIREIETALRDAGFHLVEKSTPNCNP